MLILHCTYLQMSEFRRTLGFGVVVSLVLAVGVLFVDRTANTVIFSVEKVVQPCAHGGRYKEDGTCECEVMWGGDYCTECTCVNGVCDTVGIQVEIPGTMWGCRCKDPKTIGPLCSVCNANLTEDGRCAGACKEGYTGFKCDQLCNEEATYAEVLQGRGGLERELAHLNYGGRLEVCSGHGMCSGGTCECAPFYFSSEDGRSSCERTCLKNSEGVLCSGNGLCRERSGFVSCQCKHGYELAPDCSIACPGVEFLNGDPCSGRGSCRLGDLSAGESADKAYCDCSSMFRGEACRYRCPSGETERGGSLPCSGHGECAMGEREVFGVGNVTAAVCVSCDPGYSGPSCDCSKQGKCSGHGTCNEDGSCNCDPLWAGENCGRCIPNHFGFGCNLKCSAKATGRPVSDFEEGIDIDCGGMANCAVVDFALATEKVVCSQCVNNLASQSFCRSCREDWWPKTTEVDDIAAACTTHGGGHTCNNVGWPADDYGKPGSTSAPCVCDQPNADPYSYCTRCKPTYYPPSFGDDPDNACTRRCVDDLDTQAAEVENITTRICLNGGKCSASADCACIDGYSGETCAIGCGQTESGGQVCSGHGKCVSMLLQNFLEHRIGVDEASLNASRCECESEYQEITEQERLSVFKGEAELSGDTLRDHSPWFGETCGHGCLSPPWLHSDVCNSEGDCEPEPFVNDAGSAIKECQFDADCGEYSASFGLEFFDAFGTKRDDLSQAEVNLRNELSAWVRFSPLQGPFCHNTNDVPVGIWEPNLQCVQRTNEDIVDLSVESGCEKHTTRNQCLGEGEGNCKFTDVCANALTEFDTWSYCYVLMSTRQPPILSNQACSYSCNATALASITWSEKCAHYQNRLPAEFESCSSVTRLDGLCSLSAPAEALSRCVGSLPPEGGASNIALNAADASAYCWEVGAVSQPFAFVPLLQERSARELQVQFDELFLGLGERDSCLASAQFDLMGACAEVPLRSVDLAPILHKCRIDGEDKLSKLDLSGTGVDCETLPTVRDLNPFVLHCDGEATQLSDLTLLEALEMSLRPEYKTKCSLRGKTPLHSEGVGVSFEEAGAACSAVLESESPSACTLACGDNECSDLGELSGSRVLQCSAPAGDFLGVNDEGKCDKCLVGECSVTGRGRLEYRCIVEESDLAQSHPYSYAPCQNLLLHADRLGYGDASASGVAGVLPVGPGLGTLGGESLAAGAGQTPVRVEFDLLLDSASRGRVSLDGVNGSLTSLLLHNLGGRGWDVNGANPSEPCATGDECKTTFPVNEFVSRITFDLDWSANTSTVTVGGESKTRPLFDAGAFTGMSVGGSARIQNLWVFGAPAASVGVGGIMGGAASVGVPAASVGVPPTVDVDLVGMCSDLHRGLGRAITWRQSLTPASDEPLTSVGFCARLESAFAAPVSECRHHRDATFEVPWDKFCDYADHLANVSETGDCEGGGLDREATVECEPELSRFSSQSCAYDASRYDWDGWCESVRSDVVPDALAEAGCSAECLEDVEQKTDMFQLCEDREPWWDSSDAPKPQIPEGCANTPDMERRWSEAKWEEFCTAKAENKALGGVCSFASCNCRDGGGWQSGQACELDCPFNSGDLSPCAEDSFAGVCTYRANQEEAADAYYADPVPENWLSGRELTSIPGRCLCSHDDALAKDGCRVECSKDGAPACNNNTYTVAGEEYQISSCDVGGTGACRCLAPYTRKVTKTLRYQGRAQEILVPEYGAPPNANDSFRVHAAQGAISFVENYLKKPKGLWRDYRLKFENNPTQFSCEGRPCTSHDVVLAQSLWGGNGNLHYGSTCSRPCPGVDMGVDMVAHDGCGVDGTVVGADVLLTQDACKEECLSNFQCVFLSFSNSECKMYSDCPSPTGLGAEMVWFERKKVREPVLEACGGRGVCTTTGQCSCDMAKMLVITSPITGEKAIVGADDRGSTLANVPLTVLEKTPFRGRQCELTCPGWNSDGSESMATVCSGRGICTRDTAQCVCDAGWTGQACELPCPVSDGGNSESICSGHGICSEMRLGPEEDKEEESTKRVYMISEAFRKWHNECEEKNEKLDYFILPFGNFNGTVPMEELRGGKDCSLVPQQQGDDPTLPWVVRPELTGLDYLTDFQMFDSEQDLAAENYGEVDGVSNAHDRTGMFRWRLWEGGNQTVFVEDYAVVETITNTSTRFEKFPGFRCGGTFMKQENLLSSVGECAEQCENIEDCACFHWKPNLHTSYVGKCVLAKAGPLISYEVRLAVEVINGHGGLLREDADGVPMPFDQFAGAYVEFFKDRACRAPTQVLGSGVTSIPDCAALCAARNTADANSCLYFSYNQQTLTCQLVRTATAECPEGFSTNNPSGFYAVVSAKEGTAAPTAYTSTSSARVFPVSKATRGRRWGSYTGRARPGYTVGLASCTCTANLAFGYFDSMDCSVCAKFYSTKTCSKKCVGIQPDDSTCFGFGQCIWGMEHEGNCMCGSPPAPVGTGLNVGGGAFDIQESDLEVTVKFAPLSTTAEFWEDPRNYRFANKFCSACQTNYGGLNCASQASYCLFGSSPMFTASQTVGVPCQCLDTNNFSPYHSCCPRGFMLSEAKTHADVGGLTTSQRRKRLNAQPGEKADAGTFYDTAINPSKETAPNPSRRWCMPCPNIYESDWLRVDDPNAEASACKGTGSCSNLGKRRMIISGVPPRYTPKTCLEIGWEQTTRDLYYVYEDAVFLNASNQDGSSQEFSNAFQNITKNAEKTADQTMDEFIADCQALCSGATSCTGFVLKQVFGTTDAICFLTTYAFVGSVTSSLATETTSKFSAFRLERQYGFCSKNGVSCALGTTTWGEIPFCADVELEKHSEDDSADPVRISNMGERKSADSDTPDVETRAPGMYAPSADGFVFGAYGNDEFDVTALNELKLGQMRPENPCSSLGDEWYWDASDRSQCKSSSGQTCEVNDWVTCKNQVMEDGNLHRIHDKLGEWPHRVYVGEIEREVAIFDLTLEYGPRPLDQSALIAERDRALAKADELKREYEQLQADVDFVLPDVGNFNNPHSMTYHVGWEPIWYRIGSSCTFLANLNCVSDSAYGANIFASMLLGYWEWDKDQPGYMSDYHCRISSRHSYYQDGCKKKYLKDDLILGNVWNYGGSIYGAELEECGPHSDTWNKNPCPSDNCDNSDAAITQCLGVKQAYDEMQAYYDAVFNAVKIYEDAYTDCFNNDNRCKPDDLRNPFNSPCPCVLNPLRNFYFSMLEPISRNLATARIRYEHYLAQIAIKKNMETNYKTEAQVAQQAIDNALESDTCSPGVPCDVCQSNCDHDNECKTGLVCVGEYDNRGTVGGIRTTPFSVHGMCFTKGTNAFSSGPGFEFGDKKYCIPENIESTDPEWYMAGYIGDEATFITTILEVDANTREVVQAFAASQHAWDESMERPTHSGSLNAIRASLDINAGVDNREYTLKALEASLSDISNTLSGFFGWLFGGSSGTSAPSATTTEVPVQPKVNRAVPFRGRVYSSGIAGAVVPPSYALSPENQGRGIVRTETGANACGALCEETAGCTYAEQLSGGLPGIEQYSRQPNVCRLYDDPVSADFECDSSSDGTENPHYVTVDSGSCKNYGYEMIRPVSFSTVTCKDKANDMGFSEEFTIADPPYGTKTTVPVIYFDTDIGKETTSDVMSSCVSCVRVLGETKCDGDCRTLENIEYVRGYYEDCAAFPYELSRHPNYPIDMYPIPERPFYPVRTDGAWPSYHLILCKDHGAEPSLISNWRKTPFNWRTADGHWWSPHHSISNCLWWDGEMFHVTSRDYGSLTEQYSFFHSQQEGAYTTTKTSGAVCGTTVRRDNPPPLPKGCLGIGTSKYLDNAIDGSAQPPCGTQTGFGQAKCICKVPAARDDFKLMVRRPNGCGLCRSRGEAQSNIELSTGNYVMPQCGACDVFPKATTVEGDVTTIVLPSDPTVDYVFNWQLANRCAPVRATTSAYTALTRIGQIFRLSDSDPYTVVEKNIDFFAQCEEMCISDRRCKAWHFYENTVFTSSNSYCELFDYTPVISTTISGEENVFSATDRIGTVERDFGARTAIIDDGANAACECETDSPGEGYDCGCVPALATPFLPEKATNDLYGCSGHGRCLGTSYGCACDPGYEWGYSQTPEGWSCYACAAGKYRDDTLSQCASCPFGKYSTSAGDTACQACDFGKTTFALGATANSFCADCPAGRIAGDTPGTCQACPMGKYEAQVGTFDDYTQRECKDCEAGFTTLTRGSSTCNIVFTGCGIPGKGWVSLDTLSEDSGVLGNSRCADCGAGKYSLTGNECLDCPAGRQSTRVGHNDECFECVVGRYNDEEGLADCKECPIGTFQPDNGATTCTICAEGKYQDQTGAPVCEECAEGTYQPSVGMEMCETCAAGTYQNTTGSSACKNCTAGRYQYAQGSEGCKDCPSGQFQDMESATECKHCAENWYQPDEGTTSCKECPIGWVRDAAENARVCTIENCPAGKYSGNAGCTACPQGWSKAEEGVGDCDECGKGEFQDTEGATACKRCAQGQFQGATGNDVGCENCPIGWFTGVDGSHYCFECFEGQYADQEGYGYCYNCPEGWSQSQKGQEECEACAAGEYQDDDGEITCHACPSGWDSAETGSVDCLLTSTTTATPTG